MEKNSNEENYDILQKSNSQSPSMSMKVYKKRGNFILRQELRSYTPECNSRCGIIFNLVLLFVFLAAGIPIIYYSKQVVEYIEVYTDW
jgi:hypothetical protein